MDTKKLRNVLVGDYEVPGAKDNLWIDTSNPNVAVEKIYDRDKWVEVGNTSDIIAKNEEQDGRLDIAEANIEKKQDAPETAGSNGQILSIQSGEPTWVDPADGSTVDSSMMDDSSNPVQNKVIKAYVDTGAGKANADELTITPGTGSDADKTTIQLKTGTSATVLTGHQSLSDYAKTDGYYETLGAGTADNLRGQSVTSEHVLFRMTGGTDTELANGIASLEAVGGHSVVWNQVVPLFNVSGKWIFTRATDSVSEDGLEVAVTGNDPNKGNCLLLAYPIGTHKYYMACDYKASIGSVNTYFKFYGNDITTIERDNQYHHFSNICTTITDRFFIFAGNGETMAVKNLYILDLTLMGIDNLTTVAQVEEWLAKNVGLKDYYDYNAGTILNAKPERLISTGRNLLNPTTGEAYLKTYEWEDNDNTYEIIGTYTALSYTDVLGNTTTPVPDTNGKFVIPADGVLTVTAADLSQVCVQAVWDETYDGEFVEFSQDEVNIDVTKIYGQLNGEGELVQVYPNGMLSVGSVKDVLTKDSAVVNTVYFTVQLDTVFDTTGAADGKYYCKVANRKFGNNATCLCGKYTSYLINIASMPDMSITGYNSANVQIRDTSLANKTASEVATALAGTVIICERATPLTYTNLVYRDGGVDIPWSLPMQYIVDNWGTERVESVETEGAAEPQTCAPILDIIYAMDAVEEIDTLKTNGVMVTDLKSNIDALLVALNSALTDIGTITVSETATDKVFSFTFTPAESEP